MTAIIVEDEKRHQDKLVRLLSHEHPDVEILGMAGTLQEARELLIQYTPEILFLDIELGSDNGFDLIKKGISSSIKPIVISSYSKYGVAACNLSATAFIEKGELEEKLSWAIEKAQTSLNTEEQAKRNNILTEAAIRIPQGLGPDRLVISTRSIDYFVPIDSIICLEAQGNNVNFFLDDAKEVPSPSCGLKFYTDALLQIQPKFQKPHNSFLINMEKVEALMKGNRPQLIMSNAKEVPISKPNVAKMKEALSVFGIGY